MEMKHKKKSGESDLQEGHAQIYPSHPPAYHAEAAPRSPSTFVSALHQQGQFCMFRNEYLHTECYTDHWGRKKAFFIL